jgi:intracellular sulfur oxidation DsrE/DsrF family protein
MWRCGDDRRRTVPRVHPAVPDGADEVQDAAIRYAGSIFDDKSVEIDAVAVAANAAGIELGRSDSDYTDEIAELSDGDVQLVACEKSMRVAGLTRDDILDVAETATTSVGELDSHSDIAADTLTVILSAIIR